MQSRRRSRFRRPAALSWAGSAAYGRAMDIYSRFKALPRARKGDTTVVIVDEIVLAELIAAAQTSEAKLFGARDATVGSPVAMQIHVDLAASGPNAVRDIVRVIEDSRPSRRRRGW